MTMRQKTATVFGGTGFIGAQIVRELAKKGWVVKVATRVPERAFFLRPCGVPGQIVPIACASCDPDGIAAAVRGSDFVVNCIGILYERGKAKFRRAHIKLPGLIAQACARERVSRFVHLSALGVNSGSKYGASKRDGEAAVSKAFPDATILRPSVVFGPDDRFFNLFAELARYTPVLPLIGGGGTRFQPTYVGDVADAVLAALTLPGNGPDDPRGKIYELGGPDIVTFREIYERLFRCTGRRRILMTLPWGLAKIDAAFLSLLPKPPLTPDQVESLKTDSVVCPGALTFDNLGIHPAGMDLILPSYLDYYRPGGRFAQKSASL